MTTMMRISYEFRFVKFLFYYINTGSDTSPGVDSFYTGDVSISWIFYTDMFVTC